MAGHTVSDELVLSNDFDRDTALQHLERMTVRAGEHSRAEAVKT